MADNATIYSVNGRPVTATDLADLAPGATVSEHDGALSVTWPDVSVRLVVMPEEHLQTHLGQFANYMVSMVGGDIESIAPLLAPVASVRQVIGCVVDPGYDAGSKAKDLISRLTLFLDNCVLFANGQLYDAHGRIWFGDPASPPFSAHLQAA